MAGGLAFDAGWLLVIVLIAGLLAAIGIAVRRTLLERGGGTVECAMRRGPDQDWQLGLGVYQLDELRWYRAFGVRMRPAAVFARSGLAIVSRRPVDSAEAASLGAGAIVVECKVGGPVSSGHLGAAAPPARGPGGSSVGRADAGLVELAMSEAALTGFLAWLEAAPPGDLPGFS